MISRRSRRIALACGALWLAWVAGRAQAACAEPELGTDRAPLVSPAEFYEVVGAGRLQFYSAPDFACKMRGVFVIPKDTLIVYALTRDGWASVMYVGARDTPMGWVRSDRLKDTGGAVAPKN
jgi:hypothetical protein